MRYNIKPYLELMRLDKPTGTFLLLFPGLWSIVLATKTYEVKNYLFLKIVLLFCIGAVIMRGAGCVVNDIIDRDIDGKVKRTAERPIAAGEISPRNAIVFLSLLMLTGFIILLQFNMFTVILGSLSILPIILYPFMKRIISLPQIWLAFIFNWGALLGWAAVAAEISFISIAIYCLGFLWTLSYDTIYAHQDRKDDISIGINSSAIYLGNKTFTFLNIINSAIILLLVLIGIFFTASLPYYLIIVIAAFLLFWQAVTLNIEDRQNCFVRFNSNIWVGLIILISFSVI